MTASRPTLVVRPVKNERSFLITEAANFRPLTYAQVLAAAESKPARLAHERRIHEERVCQQETRRLRAESIECAKRLFEEARQEAIEDRSLRLAASRRREVHIDVSTAPADAESESRQSRTDNEENTPLVDQSKRQKGTLDFFFEGMRRMLK